MILEGNERGYGAELARHLMNVRDNDHVTVHTVDGFVADDLLGAFAEAEAISGATQCKKYLFSLSLNPPIGADVSVADFEATVAQAEERLGLSGQPRAIVFHEKNGRRHAHAVWSRIEGQRLKAINISHYKRKLTSLSHDLFLTHGWDMPAGLRDAKKRDPLNYTRHESGQAKQTQRDPKAVKAMFRACWDASDSKAGFEAALKEQGFALACGDRRGFVAIDTDSKVWSLSRWCGVKAKEMRQRLGPETDLPSVQDVAETTRSLPKQPVDPKNAAFEARRAKLVVAERAEREALLATQEKQRHLDIQVRQASLPKGLRGLLARATGQYRAKILRIEVEVNVAEERARAAQHALVKRHLVQRQELTRAAQSQGLALAFENKARSDPNQELVLRDDSPPYSKDDLIRTPDLALHHLSQMKAAFKRVDVLRVMAQRIDDPLVLQKAADQAMQSPSLVRLPDDGTLPVFTTQDYRDAERSLDQSAHIMATSGGHGVSQTHIKQAITSQNAQMHRVFGGQLSDEQCSALQHVLGGKQLSSVVGLAGAGKSTLLATARDAWARQGLKVHGAALAGKAAEELESASGIQSRTLASFEMSWKNGYEPVAKGDVLVIDEAGMIGTRQLARVAAKMNEVGAKLVLVGDPDQLQPIEAGTPFRRLTTEHGAAKLTEIHRQKVAWQKQASRDLADGDLSKALEAYNQRNAVTRGDDRQAALEALVETYTMDVAAHGKSKSRLAFAHKRKDVHALNQAIRSALRSNDRPQTEVMFSTETGKRAFASDDRIVFTRNDKDIGVKNGMLGTVIEARDGKIAVALDGDVKRQVAFNPQDFKNFDHGYAVTIHKSQGATVDQSYVLASRSMDRHLAYVAMTRHRDDMRLFVNERDRPVWAIENKRQLRTQRTHTREGPTMG